MENERSIKYIRHTFEECYLRAMDEPFSKTVTRIYCDGKVIQREFLGKKVTSVAQKHISKAAFEELVRKMENALHKGEFARYCDAMSSATIVYENGKTKYFRESPLCLEIFVDTLF